jgi:hypothetical protein
MKAGNEQSAFSFDLVKQSVWKAPYSCSPSLPVDSGKAQWILRDDLDGIIHRLHESP